MRCSKHVEKELLCRVCSSCRAEEEIECIALRIHGSIEVHPLLFDLDGCGSEYL